MKRFIRDAGILLTFCGAFYLVIVFVSRLDGDSNSDANEFSPVRKRADAFVENKDWDSAIAEYQKLTRLDPYNGHAWQELTGLIWEVRRVAIFDWNLLEAEERESAKGKEISQKIKDTSDRVFKTLMEVSKFARYRSYALFRLAILESDRSNYDEALDHLEEFVGRGFMTNQGLSTYQQFGDVGPSYIQIASRKQPNVRLHQFDRFWAIARQERTLGYEPSYRPSDPVSDTDWVLLPRKDPRTNWGLNFRNRRSPSSQ